MEKQVSVLLSLAFLVFSSCISDSSSKNLVDGYELAWIDSKNNRSIYKGEEQIPGYIFSVGFNNDFIIAKQHPLKGDFYSEPDFSVTNYYIIDLAENKKGYRKGVIGPLSAAEFDKKMNDLEIKGKVKFTLE